MESEKSISYYGEEKEYGEHHYGYKPKKKKVYVPVFVPEKDKKKSKIFVVIFVIFCLYFQSLLQIVTYIHFRCTLNAHN